MSDEAGCGCAVVLIVLVVGGGVVGYQCHQDQAEAEAQAADFATEVWESRVRTLEIRVDELEERGFQLEADLEEADMRVDQLESERW